MYSIAGSPHILNFVLGIVLAFSNIGNYLSKLIINKKAIARIIFVIIQFLFIYEHIVMYDIKLSLIITVLFFTSWLHVDKIFEMDYSSRFSRFIVYLGDISFSIYLTHILVIDIIMNFLEINNVYLLITLATTLTIGLSAITYKYIEVPFITLARNLTRKKPVIITSEF